MSEQTPLDQAYTDSQNTGALLGFYEVLAASELLLLLEREPRGDAISPRIFPVDGQDFALVFDRDTRLASFAEKPAPFVAMSGRAIVAMLTGRAIGLGLNMGVAPSSFLMPSSAVDWLADVLEQPVTERSERPVSVGAPDGFPAILVQALQNKLNLVAGLAQSAHLVRATYAGGQQVNLLAFSDALPGASGAISQAVNEAVLFSSDASVALDIGFFASSDPLSAQIAKNGQLLEIPVLARPARPTAPGSDPDKPPRLR